MNGPNTINLAPKTLTPPVSKNKPLDAFASALHDSRALQPALFLKGNKVLRPSTEPSACLAHELKTPRLNDIHQHLWLAGLPAAARPLHRQRLLGRTILVTEDPDEHLVWFETDIFIKPLPEFLFDWDFWHDRLCLDEELHKAACGLLLSYAWLVQHKSDLEVAKESGLLSRSIEWAKWVHFMDAFLDNIDCETMINVNKRYRYGELRLSRLNAIYRFAPPRYSVRNLVRGYQSGSSWYKAFFERHFKWMLAVFAVLSVVLSALQVGLATVMLQGNGPFQSASYGFTVFSLVAMVASVLVVSSVWVGLFCYYLLVTWRNDRAVNRKRVVSASSL